jgi:hypothetical protein
MKKQFNKYYIAFFFLCTNFYLFAQPSSENDTANLESNEAVQAPIDDQILILILIGVLYVFFKLKTIHTKNLSQIRINS